jgi:hypothetical protein
MCWSSREDIIIISSNVTCSKNFQKNRPTICNLGSNEKLSLCLQYPIKTIKKDVLLIQGNNFIFNCNLKPENIENVPIKNKFWRDLLKYFFELKSKTTEPLQGDSIIWFNSLLKIEGKTLYLL